jgi:hypothetical protein
MEQEPDSPILYNTLRRVGYNLAIATHAVFIVISIVGAVVLVTALLIG